jgi:methyltransferase (TIGR00027 family)
MKTDQTSLTADYTAAVRAAHVRYDHPVLFEDPLAIHLTSWHWRRIIKNPVLYRLVVHAGSMLSTRRRATFVARARYTEDRLESAIRGGVGQYVILAAGLDSFAWRRPEFADCLQVYEIDHPASQRIKRDRIGRLGLATPKNLEWIATDLARECVAGALQRSRYRRDARSFFSLLGVVQYLPRETVMNTLRSIADASAPGSELVLSYVQPLHLFDPKLRPEIEHGMRWTARRGEPFVSFFDPQEFPAAVCQFGYELIENCGPRDIEQRYFTGRTDELQPGSLRLSYIAHFRVSG